MNPLIEEASEKFGKEYIKQLKEETLTNKPMNVITEKELKKFDAVLSKEFFSPDCTCGVIHASKLKQWLIAHDKRLSSLRDKLSTL